MDAGTIVIISLVGFALVFAVLIVIMGLIKLISVAVNGAAPKAAVPVQAEEPVQASAPAVNPNMVPATGSLGEVQLNGIEDETAAMLMAIVADKMEAPLNELRFISIREI